MLTRRQSACWEPLLDEAEMWTYRYLMIYRHAPCINPFRNWLGNRQHREEPQKNQVRRIIPSRNVCQPKNLFGVCLSLAWLALYADTRRSYTHRAILLFTKIAGHSLDVFYSRCILHQTLWMFAINLSDCALVDKSKFAFAPIQGASLLSCQT